MRIGELRKKEVINVKDGTRFGYMHDVEIDIHNGFIKTIIIPVAGKGLNFLSYQEAYHIPWESITQIGDDIILVDVDIMRDRIVVDPK